MDWLLDGAAEAEKARREKEALEQGKLEGVVRQLAGTNDGIFFLRWLLRETGALVQEYPADERLSVWQAGRRSVGMQIFSLCAAVNCADKVCAKQEQTNG